MPLVQIHLREGKSAAYLRALSNGIDAVTSTAFATKDNPRPGKFQTISTYKKGYHFVDKSFANVKRSDQTIYITILTTKMPTAAKKKLYKDLVKRLGKAIKVRKEALFIAVIELPAQNWFIGKEIG